LKKNISKYCYRLIVLSLLIFANSQSFSQDADAQLALKYFQNQDYDKAATIYEKLYRETGYKNNRDYYIRCLTELKDYETAETFLKKELKKNKTDFYINIDLGMVYFNTNRFKEATTEFDKVVNVVKNNNNNVQAAAGTFMMYRQFDYAEKVYLAGEKTLNVDFNMELGNLFYSQRDYERMMKAYLDNLENNPQSLTQIQARLQYTFANDIDQSFDSIVETIILERIQESPQNNSFNKLLIWQYTQTGRYKVALTQLIAIDKRTKSNELDILEFGVLLYNNNQYDLAMEAFDYLMQKGKENSIYNSAYIEYLNVLYAKTTAQLAPSKEELIKLESMLAESLNFILRKESYSVVYALANIKAFYLNEYSEAIDLLTKCITERRFLPEQESYIKLLLGDIYFLNSNPWDAILVYAQVEKSDIENPIGHEARFKKAKLAYYTGQFKWAQAQLDVLKSSTSKLIANDAMELSIFITDNYNLDTSEIAMQIFSRADFYIFSKQYNKAFSSLDSLLVLYPTHSLKDDVLFKKATIFEATNNLVKACEFYNEVATDYSFDILADNSLFRYAILQEKLRNFENAKTAYFKLIADYPGSIFTVEARKNLRKISNSN
jgi:tetratricopeptide (TPR) repeat protein